MIPNGKSALSDLAVKLLFSVAPETSSMFVATNTGMIATLMQCLAQELDQGVAVRLHDIEEMKAIFAGVAPRIADDLGGSVATFRDRTPTSYRLGDVTAVHAEALELLIALHERAEAKNAAALDEEIWQFLERMAERHKFDV
ncbi:MAG: hypothetical protein HC809_09390 [Gammaproteobacteria bacterium]|nr:hypothetical protein [Gammaproteobacteria bacterium]